MMMMVITMTMLMMMTITMTMMMMMVSEFDATKELSLAPNVDLGGTFKCGEERDNEKERWHKSMHCTIVSNTLHYP